MEFKELVSKAESDILDIIHKLEQSTGADVAEIETYITPYDKIYDRNIYKIAIEFI